MEQVEKRAIGELSSPFTSKCKLILYCVYPAISKSPKHLSNSLKITKASVIVIVFNGVICDVSTSTVTVSFCRST